MRLDEVASISFIAASIFLGTQAMQTSLGHWQHALDEGVTWDSFREELMGLADLERTHHEVYAQVDSDETWEQQVKPRFLQRVAVQMIQDLGADAIQQEGAADAWLRQHHDWVLQTLQAAAQEVSGPTGDGGGSAGD